MAHEDLNRKTEVDGSSDRSFGLLFAGLFSLIAVLPLFHKEPVRWWAVGMAAAFALVALTAPAILSAPNRLWKQVGLLLGAVASPIATGILLFGAFTPIAVVMRLAGKDPLRLKLDPKAKTYWIERKPPGPPPDSMTNQF